MTHACCEPRERAGFPIQHEVKCPASIARDRYSQDARSLAEALYPWPATLEDAWAIIENRLAKVRADAHAQGKEDA